MADIKDKDEKEKKPNASANADTGKKKKKRKMSPNSLNNLIRFNDMTKEDMKAIQMKGKIAKQKKRHERMQLQKCLRTLLEMDVADADKRDMLLALGFSNDELTNHSLVVTSLLESAVNGNVLAIREIANMQKDLDEFEDGNSQQSQQIIINVNSVGDAYEMTDEDEQAIRDAADEENTGADDDSDSQEDTYDVNE